MEMSEIGIGDRLILTTNDGRKIPVNIFPTSEPSNIRTSAMDEEFEPDERSQEERALDHHWDEADRMNDERNNR